MKGQKKIFVKKKQQQYINKSDVEDSLGEVTLNSP